MNDSNIDDGGPAFPITEYGLQGYSGMSLRDWFAGQALAGMLRNQSAYGSPSNAGEWSYQFADAMIEARKINPPTTP